MQRNPNRTRYPVRNTRSLSRASTSWRHTTNQGNAEGSTDVTSDPLGHPEASRTRTPNRQQPAGIHDANFQPYSYIDNSRGGIINNTINTIQQDNSRTTKNELLSRSCTRATFTGEIRAVKLKCHPETRKSIISDIEGPWRVSLDGSPGILMLTGPVGTGKSTIALQVCNDLNNEHPRLLIGTFFFWRNDGDRNSLKCFVATIAYRIAVVMPEVGRIMEDIISRDPSILDSTIEHQWNSLVIEPLCRALAGVLPCATHRPLIVIDGLDECKSSSDHQQLLQLLITFLEHGLGKWFAFLVASRPESHITSEVEYLITQRPSYFRSPSLMLAETEESRADMKLILDTRFNGIYHRRRLVIGSHQWPPSGAVEHIIDLSKGQFIYVLTIVRWLEDDDGDPIRRLQVIFDASNDEKARAFAPLDMLYNLILESATSKEAGYLVVPCLALIIGFGEWKIALLGNSLLSDVPEDDDSDIQEVGSSYTTNIHSVKELAAFWNKAPEFIFLTLQPLHSVLQLLPCDKDHDTRDVAFFHTSFSEYLQNPLRSQTYNITDPKVLNSLVIQALNLASEPRGFLLPFPFFWMLIPSAGAFIMITEDLLAALSNFNYITWFQESFMFLAQYEEGLEQHLKSMYEEKFIPWLKSSLPEERQTEILANFPPTLLQNKQCTIQNAWLWNWIPKTEQRQYPKLLSTRQLAVLFCAKFMAPFFQHLPLNKMLKLLKESLKNKVVQGCLGSILDTDMHNCRAKQIMLKEKQWLEGVARSTYWPHAIKFIISSFQEKTYRQLPIMCNQVFLPFDFVYFLLEPNAYSKNLNCFGLFEKLLSEISITDFNILIDTHLLTILQGFIRVVKFIPSTQPHSKEVILFKENLSYLIKKLGKIASQALLSCLSSKTLLEQNADKAIIELEKLKPQYPVKPCKCDEVFGLEGYKVYPEVPKDSSLRLDATGTKQVHSKLAFITKKAQFAIQIASSDQEITRPHTRKQSQTVTSAHVKLSSTLSSQQHIQKRPKNDDKPVRKAKRQRM